MNGLSAVTIVGDDSASRRSRAGSAEIPVTHRDASRLAAADRRLIEPSRLRAITGIMTFSSKFPADPPNATAVSLPITWAQTWPTASQITGLTLPGMIDDPGCRSGILI